MKLGRYEVVRELGKGAMGIVYLAKDPLIGRLVALKTIRPAAVSDDDETREFQQRFMREAQAAGILNHPSIVTVFDIGLDEPTGVSFIAMEYVEGHNLKEVLAQGRPLSFDQIADIVAQVADALDFAHSKGIVHRDVKPANIILIDGTRAKITDFGIAKIASAGGANLTSTGQFLGTPNYMAPEQIRGTPVDGRTDLFSLGICLYECLTRRKPFGGDSLTSISYKIVHEPFPPLDEINPQIPEGFTDVVTRCLAKEPEKRYQRGSALVNALRAVIRGERPPPPEPLGTEETMITHEFVPPPFLPRDDVKIPTIEIPFPEADSEEPTPARPRPAMTALAEDLPAEDVAYTPEPSDTRPAPHAPRPPVREQIRQTFSDVRASPLWKRPIAPPIFFGVVGVLVAGLLATVIAIQSSHPETAAVDVQSERRGIQQRKLRMEANHLLEQGRVNDAYTKLTELRTLAPNSPYVGSLLRRLETIRQREELSRQQLALAQQKLQQGITLFNEKKYGEAIPLLEESFHINPSSEEATKFLKLAQIEQDKQQALLLAQQQAKARPAPVKVAVKPPPETATGSTAAGDGGQQAISNAPVQITTFFRSPVTDGHILVKAGTQVVAHENLWEEKGRVFRRRASRVVNVTASIAPVNTDLEVWVVIPSLKIQEHKVFPQNFRPGATHRLVVTFDTKSRKFDFQFN